MNPSRAGHSGHRVDTEISGSPAKPLWLERSWAEGPDLPTHSHTHSQCHTRTQSHSHTAGAATGAQRQQIAERRRAPSAISDPVRLLPERSPEAAERGRTAGAERCRTAGSSPPLGAVHHANRLKAATGGRPRSLRCRPGVCVWGVWVCVANPGKATPFEALRGTACAPPSPSIHPPRGGG